VRRLCQTKKTLSQNFRGLRTTKNQVFTGFLVLLIIISLFAVFSPYSMAVGVPSGAKTQGDQGLINVELTNFVALPDKYGKPAINPDGSFYPNDKFTITYSTEVAENIAFEGVEAIYSTSTFNMFDSSNFGSKTGTGSFEITPSATTGNYSISVRASGSRFFDHGTQDNGVITVTYGGADIDAYYTTQYSLTIADNSEGTTNPSPGQYWLDQDTAKAITAIPHSGYLFSYWILDGHNATTNSAITVVMNAPHSLQACFKQQNNPQNTSSISNVTFATSLETKQFMTQAALENQAISDALSTVTFTAHGLGTDATGTALEVDSTTAVNAKNLQAKFDWNVSSSHSYQWLDTISSSNIGQRYTLNNVTFKEKYSSIATLPIQVVQYDPHFTLALAYTIPGSNGGSSYDKPFAMIIRYDGNGPTYNLNQRAIIDDYTWSGYAQKIDGLDAMQQTLTPNITIANFLNQTSNAQFSAYGIDSKTNQPVLNVDGTNLKDNELPKTYCWIANSTHTYAWTPKLPVLTYGVTGLFSTEESSPYEWLEWQFGISFPPSTEQLNLIQINQTSNQEELQNQLTQQLDSPSGTLTVTPLGNTITAVYAHNKLITKFATDTGVNQNQALKCTASLPIYFDSQSRYAKTQFTLDPSVAQGIMKQNYTDALYYNMTFASTIFGNSKVLDANFTCQYEFYDKLINATAYKWNPTLGNWTIDNAVNIKATFDTAFNFTETDVLISEFENQTDDQEALKLATEDLYDATPQTFTGTGTVEANLKRTSPLYYNLEVNAGPNQNAVSVQRTVQLNFGNNETYQIPLNFDPASPLQVNVTADDTQSSMLTLNAPAELGGLTDLSIYLITKAPSGYELNQIPITQITLRRLNTLNLTQPQTQITMPPDYQKNYELYQYYQGYSQIYEGTLGYCGQTQIAISKDQSVAAPTGYSKALLYVEAKNVWGTKFHTIIAVQPYAIPKWQVYLNQVAIYLFIIIAVSIVLSLAVYIIKEK